MRFIFMLIPAHINDVAGLLYDLEFYFASRRSYKKNNFFVLKYSQKERRIFPIKLELD